MRNIINRYNTLLLKLLLPLIILIQYVILLINYLFFSIVLNILKRDGTYQDTMYHKKEITDITLLGTFYFI